MVSIIYILLCLKIDFMNKVNAIKNKGKHFILKIFNCLVHYAPTIFIVKDFTRTAL